MDDDIISSLKLLREKEVYSPPIYFSRHGQSIYNTKELIGGDSLLSEKGKLYAQGLSKLFKNSEENSNCPKKYCSTLKRTQQTISYLDDVGEGEPTVKPEIDEINAGICDSMTYEQIEEKYPEEFQLRKKDKLNYRYPEGESYIDLNKRLQPFLKEVESATSPVLIISHQATLRCVHSHLRGLPAKEIPYIQVPLHSLVKFERSAFGYKETVYKYDTESKTFKTEIHKVDHLESLLETFESTPQLKQQSDQDCLPQLVEA